MSQRGPLLSSQVASLQLGQKMILHTPGSKRFRRPDQWEVVVWRGHTPERFHRIQKASGKVVHVGGLGLWWNMPEHIFGK